MYTKTEIIRLVQNWSKENKGGTPSEKILKEELGIPKWNWINYWTKITTLQKEAGLKPQEFDKTKYTKNELCEVFIKLIREQGIWPSRDFLDFKHKKNSLIPHSGTFYKKLGQINSGELPLTILEYVKNKKRYKDIINICNSTLKNVQSKKKNEDLVNYAKRGFVYMFKLGKYYKVGRSIDIAQRYSQLSVQFPDELEHRHKIETDDPSGVETYWHTRFRSKHVKGEFFSLNSSDVKAFKRWKKIY